jgi:hypothetical protein
VTSRSGRHSGEQGVHTKFIDEVVETAAGKINEQVALITILF